MAKPIIFAIDDEVQVANAVERDLRQHYGKDYRIMKSTSGISALDILKRLKERNDAVALIISDQRMPEMEGTEFLLESSKFYPDAKKVLLTAYADTNAAIDAINKIGLDHYLMKPWSPPETMLYPVLDDLLDDWNSTAEHLYDGIRVAGTLWSSNSHRVKDFLARTQIPYQWVDIDQNVEIKNLVNTITTEDYGKLPVVFFPDGSTLVNPDLSALVEKIGLRTQATQPFYDLIIIGAGPAGLAAAVYGASEGLNTLLIDKETTGGQAGTSSKIENYLGFPKGIGGADLARRATAQADRLGAEILTAQEVKAVRIKENYKILELSNGTSINCHALIVATGAAWRTLDIPGIQKYTGAGVYYGAALSEAANFKNRDVVVVGGANSAGQGAMFFSKYAKKVIVLVRGSGLEKSMSHYLIDQIANTPNIELMVHSEVKELKGSDRFESIIVKNNVTDEEHKLETAALFIFIGATPHSDFVSDLVECTNTGFIITGNDLFKNNRRPKNWTLSRDPYLLETNVPGIFAVGDVREASVKRVASAVGQGSNAVSFVHQYLKTV